MSHRRGSEWRAAAAGLSLLLLMALVAIAFGQTPAPVYTFQEGGPARRVYAAETKLTIQNDTSDFRRAISVGVEVESGRRLAVVTFSSECHHLDGSVGDYTAVQAVSTFRSADGLRRAGFHPRSGKDLAFCADAGDGTSRPISASHQWVGVLHAGRNRVAIRFASVGGGVARLDDMTLTVVVHPLD